jgi:hypothetical protein
MTRALSIQRLPDQWLDGLFGDLSLFGSRHQVALAGVYQDAPNEIGGGQFNLYAARCLSLPGVTYFLTLRITLPRWSSGVARTYFGEDLDGGTAFGLSLALSAIPRF